MVKRCGKGEWSRNKDRMRIGMDKKEWRDKEKWKIWRCKEIGNRGRVRKGRNKGIKKDKEGDKMMRGD